MILEERNTIPSWELGSKMVWILSQVPTLQNIASGFDASTKHIHELSSFIQDIAIADSHKKLDAKIDKLIKAQKDDKRSKEKESERKLEMRSKLIQETGGPKAIEDAAIHPGGVKPKEWVRKLTAGGMKKSEAQKIVDGIIKDVKEEHKQRPVELQRAATFRSEKEANKPNPKAEEAKAPKPRKRADTSRHWILIVDEGNGRKSDDCI